MSCSSSSGCGPRAARQSPNARGDAGRHARAHGTMARSPACAMITSRASASGTSVIKMMARITKALASSRFRTPFTNSGRSIARSAIPSMRPGPACCPSHSSSGPSVACSHGLPCACTRPSLRTRAGATAPTFRKTTWSPDRIRSVPAMTSADRSPSPSGLPAGDTRSGTRTATISAPPPGTSPLLAAHGGTRYKDTRGSWAEG